MSDMKATCLKCGSQSAWIRKTHTDLLLMCLCGYQKVLFTTLVDTLEGDLEEELGDEKTVLPRKGTAFRKTLMVVAILPEASSAEITERLNELNGLLRAPGLVIRKDLLLTVSDVSSYLTIMFDRGLVEKVTARRGVSGGSTWRLSERALDLLEFEG